MAFPLRTMLLLSLGPLLARETFTKNDIKMNETEDLEVVEGDSATLRCCWTDIERQKYPVNWTKDEVQFVHQPAVVTCDGEDCGSAPSPGNNGTCCANFTLHNVTRNHAGRYSCQLIILRPIFMKLRGNGTMINVKERQSPTNGTMQTNSTNNASLSTLVPVVVSLAIVMAAVFLFILYLWKLRKRQEFDRAVRVIHEVPHEDSEVDGTSTSSSKGSSQWCQVPVYESFDYFEHGVESKGSG